MQRGDWRDAVQCWETEEERKAMAQRQGGHASRSAREKTKGEAGARGVRWVKGEGSNASDGDRRSGSVALEEES